MIRIELSEDSLVSGLAIDLLTVDVTEDATHFFDTYLFFFEKRIYSGMVLHDSELSGLIKELANRLYNLIFRQEDSLAKRFEVRVDDRFSRNDFYWEIVETSTQRHFRSDSRNSNVKTFKSFELALGSLIEFTCKLAVSDRAKLTQASHVITDDPLVRLS